MNIRYHNSLKDANEVLKRLRSLAKGVKLPKEFGFYVESYVNCREQGFTLIGYRRGFSFYASFAQCRNSDSVVVNIGTTDSRDSTILYNTFCGNIPSERAYAQARYFSWQKDKSHYTFAAEFILDQMKIFITNPTTSEYFIK